ncbi:MAG TPA: hypothetical protein DCZ71_07005 [Ruminococcus sp.]|nr:hypothetical protein [Ruminococcus sp.]
MEVKNNPFYELRTRLYASAAAGCSIIAEDFRLKRAVEAFRPMSEANKVFGKLYGMCEALLTSADPAAEISDCIALADALAVTQGTFADSSETSPAPVSDVFTPVHLTCNELEEYRGKLRKAPYTDTEFDDRFFRVVSDPRLMSAFLETAGRNGTGVAELLVQLEAVFGEKLYPLLFSTVDTSNKNATGNQIRFISSVTHGRFNDRYTEYAENEENPEGIRIAAIEAMVYSPENEESLLAIYRTSKGKVKTAALMSLARINSDHAEDAVRKAAANQRSSDFRLLCGSGGKTAVEYARSEIGFLLENSGKEVPPTHPFCSFRFNTWELLGSKKNVTDVFEKWAAKDSEEKKIPYSKEVMYADQNKPLTDNLYDHDAPEYRDMIRTLHSKYPVQFSLSAFFLALIEDPENACKKICTDHRLYDRDLLYIIRHIFSTPDGWYRIRRGFRSSEEDYSNIRLFRNVPEDMLDFLSDTSVIFHYKELEKLFPNGQERETAEENMKQRCSALRHMLMICGQQDRERVRAAAERFAWAMNSKYPCDDILFILPEVTDKSLEGVAYNFIMYLVDKDLPAYLGYSIERSDIPEEIKVSDLKKALAFLKTEYVNGHADIKDNIRRMLETHGIKE